MQMSTNLPLPPDAILFDLDNTLCDYIHAKYAACKAVVEYLGIGDYLELFEFFRRPTYSFEDTRHIHDYMQDKGIYDLSTALKAALLFDKVKIAFVFVLPPASTSYV